MLQKGILLKEEKPCYYIYQLMMGKREQTGLVCVSSVDDYEKDIIKKHEFTRPEKEKDRISHISISGAQTGNVFLAYKQNKEIDALVDGWKKLHDPQYAFTADDTVKHKIWVVDDADTIQKITDLFASKIDHTYIADGHHRAASAAKVKAELGDKAPATASWFLTTLFPSNQLRIMDYNRLVKDLNGYSLQDFMSALMDDFMITLSNEPVAPAELHEFGFFCKGQWFILTARPGTWQDDPIGVLDVTILSNNC